MNTESLLKQFDLVRNSLNRAALPFETNMLQDKVVEVSLWELMKAKEQIENMIREIDPKRFGQRVVRTLYTPNISDDKLFLCQICGDPDCQSDHQ